MPLGQLSITNCGAIVKNKFLHYQEAQEIIMALHCYMTCVQLCQRPVIECRRKWEGCNDKFFFYKLALLQRGLTVNHERRIEWLAVAGRAEVVLVDVYVPDEEWQEMQYDEHIWMEKLWDLWIDEWHQEEQNYAVSFRQLTYHNIRWEMPLGSKRQVRLQAVQPDATWLEFEQQFQSYLENRTIRAYSSLFKTYGTRCVRPYNSIKDRPYDEKCNGQVKEVENRRLVAPRLQDPLRVHRASALLKEEDPPRPAADSAVDPPLRDLKKKI